MSRVFTSPATGAGVYVFSDDHCPPHVHARHRGAGWIARIRFSFIGSLAELWSIAPLRNLPLQRTVNQLLNDIEAELPACRRRWWATKQTACLTHQWAVVSSGMIELAPATATDAKKIEEAAYDAEQEKLRVTFQDGTTWDASIHP